MMYDLIKIGLFFGVITYCLGLLLAKVGGL